MFPDDARVQRVAERIFDPFEYLMLRHAAGLLRTDFKTLAGQGELPRALPPAGAEHRPEDPRLLQLVPGTTVEVIERCSGHDGTYGVKKEFRAASMKIGRPVVERVECAAADTMPATARWPATRSKAASEAASDARASAQAAAACLRDCRTRVRWTSSAVEDLMSLEHYARERSAFRARVLEHKRDRQLAVGPNVTWSLRGPADHPVPGPGDAARRAHLRARRHRTRSSAPTTR